MPSSWYFKWLFIGFVALLSAPTLLSSAFGRSQGDTPLAFESDIFPILEAKCLGCHGANSPQAGLDLRTPQTILKGGKSGHAITIGSSDRSLLLEKIASRSMPPGEVKLTDKEIGMIRLWIDKGAPTQENIEASTGSNKESHPLAEHDVLPIFQMRCVVCHGKRKQEGGLDLRTQASRLKGGKSGPALVPGKPEESLLLKKIVSGEMPPNKMQMDYAVRPPTSAEVEVLRKWIAVGAPAAPKQTIAEAADQPLVSEEDTRFWAFQPPKKPPVPKIRHLELVRTPIDAFVLEKLEARKLSLSPEADKLTLMRRVYLDLIGMPPEGSEVEDYLKDRRPDAYELLIDRLLKSPHYGERWGKFWLDAAGYSDSEGKVTDDRLRPNAWRYRDYVIRSLNSDKPYDQFLTEQIAGDELVDYKSTKKVTPETVEKLVATGFLRMAPDGTYSSGQSFVPERMNVIADEVEVLSSSVMGLTMGCARCHNHKYDPIPQRDYYRLSAILQTAYDPYDWLIPEPTNPYNLKLASRELDIALESEQQEAANFNAPIEGEIRRLETSLEVRIQPLRERLLNERLVALPEAIRDDLRVVYKTAEEKRTESQKYLAEKFQDTLKITTEELAKKFAEFQPEAEKSKKAIEELRKKLRAKPQIRALVDMGGEPSPVYLLRRGDALSPGESVHPGVPSVLKTGVAPYQVIPPWPGADTSGRRLALARWLVQPNHPLTSRVIVNRIWMHHFGKGLVATASNFGRTGSPPSHPELLDWLATEFIRTGWSMKAMHRVIMSSAAYRQSSHPAPELLQSDPENVLLSRMPLRRMDAETVYDSILKVTERLDPTQFGQPQEVEVTSEGEVIPRVSNGGWRRSIYVLQRRTTPMTMLEVFDAPPMSPNCTERSQSTVPTQALQLMNSKMLRGHSRHAAGSLIDQVGDEPEKQIEQVYLRNLSRRPTLEETKVGVEELARLTQHWQKHLESEKYEAPKLPTARWLALATFCQTLLSSAEFIYVD